MAIVRKLPVICCLTNKTTIICNLISVQQNQNREEKNVHVNVVLFFLNALYFSGLLYNQTL